MSNLHSVLRVIWSVSKSIKSAFDLYALSYTRTAAPAGRIKRQMVPIHVTKKALNSKFKVSVAHPVLR
jgi:hypothetical protein